MKKVGVALSGSGFLGVLHIGGLCAMEDMGYEIVELAGTSGGAIVAALYASGLKGKDLKNLFKITDFSRFLEYRILKAIIKGEDGLCDGKYLLDWLDDKCRGKIFSDLTMPLTIMATNFTERRSFTFSNKTTPDVRLSFAARASSSIPIAYDSVQYGEIELQDGGMVCNIPTDKLSPEHRRIGLEVTSAGPPLSPDAGWIERGENAISLMLAANEGARIAWATETGIDVIPLPALGFSFLDRNLTDKQKEDLFKMGRKAVMEDFKKKGW